METQRSTLLNWPYYYPGVQAKNLEELKHSWVCATLELETTKLAAQDEIRKREQQLIHLQELLNKAISERDEAQEICKTLLREKQYFQKQLQQQQQQQQQQQRIIAPQVHSGSSSTIEDEPTMVKTRVEFINNGSNFCTSDSDESIISSPKSPSPSPQSSAVPEQALPLLCTSTKPLPEKGGLLQAVIKAGPLLQTLLLAGPLPQWKHPPPPLESFDIPPVTIPVAGINQGESVLNVNNHEELLINSSNTCGVVNRKRGFSYGVCDGYSSEANKYQRVLLH